MKVWIVYADVGSGHKVCAFALKEYFEEAEIVDCLQYCPSWGMALFSRGYALIVRFLPLLWAALYYVTQGTVPASRYCVSLSYRFMFRRFLQRARREKPAVIISTHFIATQLTSLLKREVPLKLITVITDFGVHPFWVAAGVDRYVCASNLTARLLMDRGVVPEKIIADGVPVRKGFLRALDRRALHKKYDCMPEQFKMLVLSSNIEPGFLQTIIEACRARTKLFVITGGNKRLESAIDRLQDPAIYRTAVHTEIWELIEIADVVLTKAGGMISIELFTKGKEVVFVQAHLGQEGVNATIVTQELHDGTWARSLREVLDAITYYYSHKVFGAPSGKATERPNPARTIEKIREYLVSCQVQKTEDRGQTTDVTRGDLA